MTFNAPQWFVLLLAALMAIGAFAFGGWVVGLLYTGAVVLAALGVEIIQRRRLTRRSR